MALGGGVAEVYRWVRATRSGLLAYCASLPGGVYTAERDDFGWGSIRNTVVHVADCYRIWLAQFALKVDVPRYRAASYADVPKAGRLFEEVDGIVDQFLAEFGGERLSRKLSLNLSWQESSFVTTPSWLMTHTITHEFHHKGQIVAWGRILGHPAPETDLAGPGLA